MLSLSTSKTNKLNKEKKLGRKDNTMVSRRRHVGQKGSNRLNESHELIPDLWQQQ